MGFFSFFLPSTLEGCRTRAQGTSSTQMVFKPTMLLTSYLAPEAHRAAAGSCLKLLPGPVGATLWVLPLLGCGVQLEPWGPAPWMEGER